MKKKIPADDKQAKCRAGKAVLLTKDGAPAHRRRVDKCGVCLQVTLFFANAIGWIAALLSLIGGLIMGFSTRMLIFGDFWLLDLVATTPVTFFVFYGAFYLVATSLGCFSTLSVKIKLILPYMLLLLLYVLFDYFLGVALFFKNSALPDYIHYIKNSMEYYGKEESKLIGMIPIDVNTYWNYLQRRGKCCGIWSWEDWRNTTIGRTKYDIPDACCNAEYDHRYCGTLIFRHPDREGHFTEDMLHNRGCLQVFPQALTEQYMRISHMGRFISVLIVYCFVCSLVILALILCEKFRPEEGIDNPELFDDVIDCANPNVANKKDPKGKDSKDPKDKEKNQGNQTMMSASPPKYPRKSSTVTPSGPRNSLNAAGDTYPPTQGPRRTSEEAPRRTSEEAPRRTSEDAPRRTSEEAPRRSSEDRRVLFYERGPQIISGSQAGQIQRRSTGGSAAMGRSSTGGHASAAAEAISNIANMPRFKIEGGKVIPLPPPNERRESQARPKF